MRGTSWGVATAPPTTDPPKKDTAHATASVGSVTSDEGHIWFYKDVSQASVQELVQALHKAAIERRVLAAKHGLPAPLPIHLHIHSYGGEVYAGFAATDAILRCPVPVHTHIEGGAASAATLFSIAGAHRTIGANSSILKPAFSAVSA